MLVVACSWVLCEDILLAHGLGRVVELLLRHSRVRHLTINVVRPLRVLWIGLRPGTSLSVLKQKVEKLIINLNHDPHS